MGERRLRIQPDVAPVPCVTCDRFIAEAYGRHREFAAACIMVPKHCKKTLYHDL